MSLWRSLTGRSRPPAPDLDALFLVPSAALALESALGVRPTGTASVCYRGARGTGFHETQEDLLALVRSSADAPEVEVAHDEFGFTWLTVRRDPDDLAGLVTDLHAVNTTLELEGFGPSLLCSTIGLADASGHRAALVYLYKQGTFYPFAPSGPRQRDTLLELQLRDALDGEVPVEPDRARWLALFGAPGV